MHSTFTSLQSEGFCRSINFYVPICPNCPSISSKTVLFIFNQHSLASIQEASNSPTTRAYLITLVTVVQLSPVWHLTSRIIFNDSSNKSFTTKEIRGGGEYSTYLHLGSSREPTFILFSAGAVPSIYLEEGKCQVRSSKHCRDDQPHHLAFGMKLTNCWFVSSHRSRCLLSSERVGCKCNARIFKYVS